jgi:hypothetical protein
MKIVKKIIGLGIRADDKHNLYRENLEIEGTGFVQLKK